jgi:hypothetical protein
VIRWGFQTRPPEYRYKLLTFNYLQMLNKFLSAETKLGRPCGTKELLTARMGSSTHFPQIPVPVAQLKYREIFCKKA